MEALTSNQAKTQFGELLLKVQRSPIEISRNGKPVAVMLSMEDYKVLEALKMELLQQKVQRSETDLAESKIHDSDALFESLIEEK